MKTITLTEQQLDTLLARVFYSGEQWAVCYSTWFVPSEANNNSKLKEAIKLAKEGLKETTNENNP